MGIEMGLVVEAGIGMLAIWSRRPSFFMMIVRWRG